ncbi:MAG: hypothetical protein M3Y84_01885 [Acidobacteriota bacterium]|nr:hypothetical protein [Acidobacteriota bacterium]
MRKGVPLWSALTCQRFGRSRLVAAMVELRLRTHRRQAASDQSGDLSPHSKELPLYPVLRQAAQRSTGMNEPSLAVGASRLARSHTLRDE